MAYNGDLSSDYLISLIQKLHFFNSNSITIPCEISYSKFVEGFNKRIEKIKKGEIIEPTHRFLSPHEIFDKDAHQLCEILKKLDDKIKSWEIRKQFIDYLQKIPDSLGYFSEGQCIDEFDDELFKIFIEQYAHANNEDKKDYSVFLLRFSFDFQNCSTEENMSTSKANFKN